MRFAVIGGDLRMLYAAQALVSGGDTVRVVGFEKAESIGELRSLPLADALADADVIVLPVRPLIGEKLNAPFADEEIVMTLLGEMIGDRPVFSGCAQAVRPYVRGRIYDYTAREAFSIRNAVLTAEAAVGLVIRESRDSVYGTRALVLGYGRIGRILSRYLRDLGADVTAAARSESARAWAEAEGISACDMTLGGLSGYSLIVNTVPAEVLTAPLIAAVSRDALLVDLASAPGGIDRTAAEARGVRCIHALALPGRTAPAAAGRVIKDTIRMIIKEENGGKDNSRLCDDRFLLHL